ncbi:hypothetical protein HZB01_02315 [Candidatus Woesearchaeota archaeon]|nr:hypothetical protein [Candidatus Woesearchaeota archaeon]
MYHKKGDLSLSTNAIVVLILAIVMLGLALGFVKGMFGNITKTFEEQALAEPEPNVATSSNPVTFSKQIISAGLNDKVVFKVGMFCNNATENCVDMVPTVTCGLLTKESNDLCTAKNVTKYSSGISACQYTASTKGETICSFGTSYGSVDIKVKVT